MRRNKMNKRRSKKVFRRTAGRMHKRNATSSMMRGGIRL